MMKTTKEFTEKLKREIELRRDKEKRRLRK